MRYGLIVLVLVLGIGFGKPLAVFASTATPTPSPTPTSTATVFITPDVNQYVTLPAVTDEAGTQIAPAQGAALSYEANTGDVAIAVIAGMIVFSVWIMFVIWVLFLREKS